MISKDKLLFWIEKNYNVLFEGKHGVGKCLGKGTPVMLHSGEILTVESIKQGDDLMGPDSCPRKVLSLSRGIDEMCKITPIKGDPFVCNMAHILCLKIAGKNEIFEITVEDFLKKSKTFQRRSMLFRSPVVFNKITNNKRVENPYILGLWLGDGRREYPAFTTADVEILDAWKNYSNQNNLTVVPKSKKSTNIDYYISSGNGKGLTKNNRNRFSSFLRKNNLINNKHIPHEYLTSVESDRLLLLAGLLDTDGYVSNNCFCITQKSLQLANDIVFLARSLGFAAYSKKCIKYCIYKNKKRIGIYYNITISGDTDKVPCILRRKSCLPRKQIKDVLKTGIKSIVPLGVGEYFGFTLDGDGRFLLGDFTVTHNTARVIEAFDEAGLNWAYFSGATMDPFIDFVGVPVKIDTADGSHIELILPKNINPLELEAIFIDEYNRSHKKVRNATLELIQFKSINGREFPKLKIVWAAINPESKDNDVQEYDVDRMDPAQKDRFHVHVDIPYRPDVEWFISRYGDVVAKPAIQWWNEMTDDGKNAVSPRRLEYALSMYKDGGDISDVLPAISNPSRLKSMIHIGPAEDQLENIMQETNNDVIAKWLSSDNNLDYVINTIRRKSKYRKFFLPLMPQERVSLLLGSDPRLKWDVLTDLEKNKEESPYYLLLQDIVKANLNKKLARSIKDKMIEIGIGLPIVKTVPTYYSVKSCDDPKAVISRLAGESNISVSTYKRKKMYSELESILPKELDTESANYTLHVLARIIEQSNENMISKDYPSTYSMINHAISCMIKNGEDHSDIYKEIGKKYSKLSRYIREGKVLSPVEIHDYIKDKEEKNKKFMDSITA